MRKTIARQLSLVCRPVDHPHARELARMGEVLDRLPEAAALVARDVSCKKAVNKGRAGMSGELVLRCVVLKQTLGLSYELLAFHLVDSPTYRAFCRLGVTDVAPKRSTLADNIKRLRPETMEQINRLLLARAKRAGVEDGKKVRIDSTVVDANIHHPVDSNLLFDVVRVLTRLLKTSRQFSSRIRFSNHAKRAKRRMFGVLNARSMAQRVPIYRELMQIARWTLRYATQTAALLSTLANPRAQVAAKKLCHYVELGNKVVQQTERRVIHGESVPATEKIVSIFEPHADVIVKDQRETLYGHKVFFNVGASGMILDALIERGNPSDAAQAIPMLERHRKIMGKVPEQAAFDAGFTSTPNAQRSRELGVKDTCFAAKGSIDVLSAVRSPEQYRKLHRFRAGVEGIISFTKRCFGLGRCLWRGYSSFKTYVWSSVVSTNLLLMARHAR